MLFLSLLMRLDQVLFTLTLSMLIKLYMIVKSYIRCVTHSLICNLKEIDHFPSHIFSSRIATTTNPFVFFFFVFTFIYLNNVFELTSYTNEDLALLPTFTPMSHLHPSYFPILLISIFSACSFCYCVNTI